MPIKDRTGVRYSKLVAQHIDHTDNKGTCHWMCLCDCGNFTVVRGDHLTGGRIRSCGCLHTDTVVTHGLSNTKEYQAYRSMMGRCYDPRYENFELYGGRGIEVCTAWVSSFTIFIKDMGTNSVGRSLEREDNTLGYSLDNCKWATAKEQSNNTRANVKVTYNGVTKNVSEWAESVGIKDSTLRERFRAGWPVAAALSIPTRKYIRSNK